MAHVTIGQRDTAHYVAIVLGFAFILIGLIGWTSPGFLGTHLSPAHNLIHLISGLASLYFGFAGTPAATRSFGLAFGVVYGLLGLAGIAFGAPGTPSMAGMPEDSHLLRVIPGQLELGVRDHGLHIVIGASYVVGALLTRTYLTGPSEMREAHATHPR